MKSILTGNSDKRTYCDKLDHTERPHRGSRSKNLNPFVFTYDSKISQNMQ